MLCPRSHIMSLFALLVALTTGLSAQFLTPEETVKLPPPAEVPTSPSRPEPTPPPTPPPPPAQLNPAPAPISPPQEADGYFADFAAYSREKNVILTWHLARGRTIERRIQLYRFTEEPRVIHDISRGTLIAKLSGEINIYEDVPPGKGTYYYAIFVESSRGLEPASFNISRNLVGPVVFQASAKPVLPAAAQESEPVAQKKSCPEFESEEVEDDEQPARVAKDPDEAEKHVRGINAVIRRTFFGGEYQRAVRELRPFLRNSSARVRAKAMFYTGLARYRLEQYDRALKYFSHPLTKKFYRRNAEFWIRKTTENLR
jgi:hypothetical protein